MSRKTEASETGSQIAADESYQADLTKPQSRRNSVERATPASKPSVKISGGGGAYALNESINASSAVNKQATKPSLLSKKTNKEDKTSSLPVTEKEPVS